MLRGTSGVGTVTHLNIHAPGYTRLSKGLADAPQKYVRGQFKFGPDPDFQRRTILVAMRKMEPEVELAGCT